MLKLSKLISRQLTRRFADVPYSQPHDEGAGRSTASSNPEGHLVASSRPTVFRLLMSQICPSEEKGDAQEQHAVDQAASQSLPRLGEVCRYEDVRNVVGDVEAQRGAQHGWEYPSPVVGVFRDDCEQEDAQYRVGAAEDQ